MNDFLDYDVRIRRITNVTAHLPDANMATRTINVRFSYVKILQRYVSSESGSRFAVRGEMLSFPQTLDINVSFIGFLLLDEKPAMRRELERLHRWGIPLATQEKIMTDVFVEVRTLVWFTTSCIDSYGANGGGSVRFSIAVSIAAVMWEEIPVEIDTRYLEDLGNAEMESMEVDAKPVPASKSSVDALERVVFDSLDNSMECTICMETIETGIKAIRMPCSHFYHQDCIVRWFQNSHFCPLCRYKMPVENA